MRKTCKNCHAIYTPLRASAQFCSGACRVAAYRKRQLPVPATRWLGEVSAFSSIARKATELSNVELADRLVEISETGDGGIPKTGRRFWYLALSHGYVNPDMGASEAAKKSREAATKRIGEILVTLRKQGRISWTAVIDLTRELDQWQIYASPREARAAMRRRYDEDRWLGQPRYPVLVVEKDTLEPVCKPMASAWQMPFASSRGYSSLTLQHDVAKMLRDRWARTGQAAIVYFISDFDPSGLDLQRAWAATLDDFAAPFEFVRIGLTRDQIDNPDLDIVRFGIGVKPSDSRARNFIRLHGRTCWEADVLPAAEIEAALDRHVRSWIDAALWSRRDEEIEQAR